MTIGVSLRSAMILRYVISNGGLRTLRGGHCQVMGTFRQKQRYLTEVSQEIWTQPQLGASEVIEDTGKAMGTWTTT